MIQDRLNWLVQILNPKSDTNCVCTASSEQSLYYLNIYKLTDCWKRIKNDAVAVLFIFNKTKIIINLKVTIHLEWCFHEVFCM